METTNLKSILVFSAILALGAGEGFAKLQLPAGQSLPGVPAPVTGSDKAGEPEKAEKSIEKPDEPAKEEKTDCDDCVIVKGTGNPDQAERAAGAEAGGFSLLASTLWGLFAVRRPKRIPRAIIRGVTVP